MSKILVTGSAGFIGSHLVDKLVELGHEVIGIDDLSTGKRENVNPKSQFITGDVRAIHGDLSKVEGVEYIFHLAAIPRIPYSIEHPLETHDVNVTGTLKVLQWAKVNGVKKVIFASSSSVYGDQAPPHKESLTRRPISPYALHKSIGEQYMALYDTLFDLPTVSLRFFNVFGPRCNDDSPYSLVIGKFLKMKKEGKPLTIFGNGNQSRDFTYVTDVVDGLVRAMEFQDVRNEIINLCNGQSTSINQIADIIGGEREYLPARKADPFQTQGSFNKAFDILGWKGRVSVKEGIKMMEEAK